MPVQNLPGTGTAVSSWSMPPETDSSGEAVMFGAGKENKTALYNAGVVPELIIGSPKAGTLGTQPAATAAFEPPSGTPTLGETQYQPLGSSADVAAYQPSTQTPLHWETVIVNTPPERATVTRNQTPPVPPLPPPQKAATVLEKLAPLRTNTPVTPLAPIPVATPVKQKVETPAPKKIVNHMNQMGGAVIEEEEVRPASVMVLVLTLSVAAVIYAVLGGMLAALAYYLNLAAAGNSTHPLINLFIKNYPNYPLLPISLALTAMLYFLAAGTMRSGSRGSWWFGMTVGVVCPGIVFGLSRLTLPPIQAFFDNPQLRAQFTALPDLNIRSFINVFTGQLVWWLVPGLLLIFKGAWHFPSKKMTKNNWLLLGFLTVFMVAPTVGYLGYTAFSTLDRDMKYAVTRQAAGFHVYRPIQLPTGWELESTFTINQAPGSLLVGRDDFVEVLFDRTLVSRVQGQPSAMVTLRQVDVPTTFDLKLFAGSVVDQAQTKEIKVQRGVGQQGFMIEKTGETGMIRVLALTTSDHVLLLLSTKEAGEDDLIALANSLD